MDCRLVIRLIALNTKLNKCVYVKQSAVGVNTQTNQYRSQRHVVEIKKIVRLEEQNQPTEISVKYRQQQQIKVTKKLYVKALEP